MAQMVRCPLTGESCNKSIRVSEKTFFLAEPKEPEDARNRRGQAIRLALEDKYKIRSALEERQPYAFTCKICEMIQSCVYGIADLTGELPNVVLELGMMLALGKPVIILRKKGAKEELELPSDVRAIEAIPFDEYIDIIDELQKMAASLLPPVALTTPIAEIEKLKPVIAEEMKKEMDKVVKDFDRLIKEAKLETISPTEERIEIPLEVRRELGKREESLRSFDRLGLTTDADTALYRGNLHFDRQEYAEALKQYDRCLTLRPNDTTALNNRGLIYHELERDTEALADYNKALKLRTDDFLVFSNRGATFNKLERYDKALADCNKAISLKPNYRSAIGNRGNAYRGLGKYEDALNDYTRVLELKPDDEKAFINRGTTYSEMERYEEALADYNQALILKKDYHEALNNRGVTYLKVGRYDEARADFNRVLQLKPDQPLAVYNMACLFSLKHKPKDAISYLEKAIGLDEKARQKAATDSDFDNIRDDPRFKKLIEGD